MQNQKHDDLTASRNEFFLNEVFIRHGLWEFLLCAMFDGTPNGHVLLELVSDFYLRVLENWEMIPKHNKGMMVAYLKKMLRSTFVEYFRSRMKVIPTTDLTLALEVTEEENFSEEKLDFIEVCQKIVNNFSLRDQEVFDLRFRQEKKEREISEILNIPIGTVGPCIMRILNRLRERFNDLNKTA